MYSQSKAFKNLSKIHLHTLKEETENNFRNFHSEQFNQGSKFVTTELKSRNLSLL